MKSVWTLWEPLAMALNSIPSTLQSQGKYHSIILPIWIKTILSFTTLNHKIAVIITINLYEDVASSMMRPWFNI